MQFSNRKYILYSRTKFWQIFPLKRYSNESQTVLELFTKIGGIVYRFFIYITCCLKKLFSILKTRTSRFKLIIRCSLGSWKINVKCMLQVVVDLPPPKKIQKYNMLFMNIFIYHSDHRLRPNFLCSGSVTKSIEAFVHVRTTWWNTCYL